MFLCYYVAWPCDLDLWPFDLESVSCIVLLNVRPTYQFLSYDYRLLSYEYWIFDHVSVIWNSHCMRMRRVTWPLNGAKTVHIFEILTPICHFQGITTKIKPCYRRKIAFSHYEGYKVYYALAVSYDLCIAGPPKSELPIHYTTFMGATMTIKGSLY